MEEQYYIPVLRYKDNTLQPRVGEIFSPLKPLVCDADNSMQGNCEETKKLIFVLFQNVAEDLLSPKVEVQAYAGPMSKDTAEIFKKKWKSPLILAKISSQPLYLKLRDVEKGLERVGRYRC